MKDGLYLKCNCCGRIKRMINSYKDLHESNYSIDDGCRIYDRHYNTLIFCNTNNNTILKVKNNKVIKRYRSIGINDIYKLNEETVYVHIKNDLVDDICIYKNNVEDNILYSIDRKYKNLNYEDLEYFLIYETAYVEV